MSPLTSHDLHEWRILGELESSSAVSQRALSGKLGIALGLTNQLVRELVRRRLVRLAPLGGLRPHYEITRAGVGYRHRVSRAHMEEVVRAYGTARARVQQRLSTLAATWKRGAADKRVVFYDDGHGVAEIGWICLQRTGLRLVGIVGESAGSSFCDLDVQPWERLHGQALGDAPFDRLVVMSFGPVAAIRARLRRCGVPRGVPFWI